MATKSNGKSHVTSDHDEKIMLFRDIIVCKEIFSFTLGEDEVVHWCTIDKLEFEIRSEPYITLHNSIGGTLHVNTIFQGCH
ncbi:hypothetical protein YC2023_039124 [Brassica napus]